MLEARRHPSYQWASGFARKARLAQPSDWARGRELTPEAVERWLQPPASFCRAASARTDIVRFTEDDADKLQSISGGHCGVAAQSLQPFAANPDYPSHYPRPFWRGKVGPCDLLRSSSLAFELFSPYPTTRCVQSNCHPDCLIATVSPLAHLQQRQHKPNPTSL
ncbi:hypothetical protein AOQ84DRAFT_230836 [Glonium stellatum]|uniref:Uncharacterized protein n=1 Tax=Glonium stellatum TaxID=574774 RepID=A0A8E2F4M9_9PEZI|nr:hypothetical protein AOQ84DRAFT_230836 [Glonium stellatum]